MSTSARFIVSGAVLAVVANVVGWLWLTANAVNPGAAPWDLAAPMSTGANVGAFVLAGLTVIGGLLIAEGAMRRRR